ncbi:hypothetical protein [Algoriphagus marincola]|uniref:hypothetical protein n=1 Tax=Algoriphagus marincola TaxID=264027 RepID=UPI00047E802B|nr:hypothetical protein [Algoriphagus marincola]
MKNKIRIFNRFILGLYCIIFMSSIFSCTSKSAVLRIKTAKSSDIVNQSISGDETQIKSLEDLKLELIKDSDEIKLSEVEKITVFANNLINLYVKSQELIVQEQFDEAEKNLLESIEMVPTKETMVALIGVYEKSNQLSKADSCRIILKSMD